MTPRARSSLQKLEQRLAEAEATIEALVSGQVDAVVDAESKSPVLLAEAQAAVRASERQLQEQAATLRASEARTRYALDAARMRLAELDLVTNEVTWSPTMAMMKGLASEQAPTRMEGLMALIHADDRQRVEEQLTKTRCEGTDGELEFRVRSPDGGMHWINGLVTVLRDDTGAMTRLLGVGSKIDERKALEAQFRQMQQMEAVGLLAGGVAHDFNNMLGVIMGHADLAMQSLDPAAPAMQDLAEIHVAAERSAKLTRQLLAFARKQEIAPRILNLNERVSHLLHILQRILGENVALEWLPAAALWPTRLDPSQLDQILINLSVNARDATRDVGTLTIATANCTLDAKYCSAHVDAVPGDFVRLTVQDTGSGMSDDVLAHVFEPFFTTKGIGEGTGLGLATVYGVVRQSGGFITVSSEVGRGSTFAIFFPRSAASPERAAGEQASTPWSESRGSETILVVEDDPALRRMVTLVLESAGYTVLAASGPTEAMQLARDHPATFDLMLTDIVLPGMNGHELAAQLPGQRAGLKRLFMSGFTDKASARLSAFDMEHGFIAKPFARAALAAKVREVLDRT